MALSPEQQNELIEMKAAYRRLISGQQVAKVSSGGRSVDYSAANIGKLEEAIAGLELVGRRRRGRAIGFTL